MTFMGSACRELLEGAVSTDNLVTSGFMDFDGCNAEEEGQANLSRVRCMCIASS